MPELLYAAKPCPPSQTSATGGSTASTACASVKAYTTNFGGYENPISENGAWSNTGLDWTNVVKNNGLACGTLTGADGYNDSYAVLAGFSPNQTASAVIHLSSSIDTSCTHEVELLLRWSDAPHSAKGYECNINFAGNCQIVRWNGPLGDFTPLAGGSAPLKNGDVLKATAIGNVIYVYLNDKLIAQVTDSTYPTGNPGIGFFRRQCGSNSDFGFTSFTATST